MRSPRRTEDPLPGNAWKLLDALTIALGDGHPRDVEARSLARRALEIIGDFVGARATSIYVADLLGALTLAATSRGSEDHRLPLRVDLGEPDATAAHGDAAHGDAADGNAAHSETADTEPALSIARVDGTPVPPDRTPEPAAPERLDPKISLMVTATRSASPLFLPDVPSFRTSAGLDIPDYAAELGKSCIVLPLLRAGEIHGVVNLADLTTPVPEVNSETRRALLMAANLLGQSLASVHAIADLSTRATRDGLTSLYNYATFYELLAREVLRAERYRTPLAILLMDLDGFKAINDHYGHLAGDRILCDLAARIRQAKRRPDLAARYAGDEFALVLPETRLAGAREVAKRVRNLVADEPFAFLKAEIPATLSIGVAEYKPGMTAVDLVRRADTNLYEAKRAGRNTVCG